MVRSSVQLDRDNARLLSGVIGSLLLHAVLFSPVLMALLGTSRPPPTPMRSEMMPDAVEPPPPDETQPLGIDKPMPSSLTWIGYEDYREHLARLAEVEQAAMTDDPTGMPVEPQPTMDSPQPTEIVEADATSADQAREDVTETHAVAQAEAEQRETAEPSSPPPPIDLMRILESLSLSATGDEPEIAADSDDLGSPDVEPIPDLVGRMLEAMQQTPALEATREESKGADRSELAPPTASQDEPASAQQLPPAAPPPAPTTADQADRDADPTSIINVPEENWKLGRPLAAQGLELRPQRPTFTILTLLTAAPCNPLCEIVFRRDGRPISARLIDTSCDPRTDEAILSSLYRWRASGQLLRDMRGEQTHSVRIRILLTRRSR